MHKSADRLYSQFKPREAVAELLKILHADGNNFEALVKLARAYIDIGDLLPENGANWQERKLKEYTIAQDYARKAMRVDPNSTWSHFWMAAAVGSIAVVSPMSKQVDLSIEIRDEVEKSIALDPKNGSAYHVYGVWHRKVAEIGGASRMFASMLYGKSLPKGSLEKSIEYLEKSRGAQSHRDRVAPRTGAQPCRQVRMAGGARAAQVDSRTAGTVLRRRQAQTKCRAAA